MSRRYAVEDCIWAFCLLCVVPPIASAWAADAGKRDFPATLVAEEPQVETEIAPQFAISGYNEARRSDFSSDLALQITKAFGFVVNPVYTTLRPGGGGLQALETGLKYQFVANAEHEFIFSAAMLFSVGELGSRAVGAESYTSAIPTIFYGKGAGDLPEGLAWARPFALTGQVGFDVPTRRHSRSSDADDVGSTVNPIVISLEGSLQYSLSYLSENVLASALPAPVATLIPLVEYDLAVPIANLDNRRLALLGTINPGLLYVDDAHANTWGLEALIPINRASGTHPGVRLQLSHSFATPWALAGKAPD